LEKDILGTLVAFKAAGLEIDYKENKETGEKRYSVEMPGGSKWIWTVAGEYGGWQNAHFHKGVEETYVVQSGVVAFATEMSGNMYIDYYDCGGLIRSQLDEHHNVWMAPGAIVHTVKTGDPVGNPDNKSNSDWWPAPGLDAWSKAMPDEAAIDAYLESL